MPRRAVADHRSAVAEHLRPAAAVARVSVAAALDLVLADPVDSPVELPPFDNSAMDGFAARAADVAVGQPLPIAHRIPAGQPARPLPAGSVAAIMTGAPLPVGADAVIPVEQSGERDGMATFSAIPDVGAFIRRRGSDVTAGARLLDAGVRLAPHHLGALAAAGVSDVAVHRPPRVAVLSTGSELVAAGGDLLPGQIYESNSTLLAALLQVTGVEVVSVGTVGDDGGFRGALDHACAGADIVITTGGVSAGEHEPARDLLSHTESGWFGAVAMQPGGPQGLARWCDTPVVCLPGNPVSVLVSYHVFVRPALDALLHREPPRPTRGRVSESVRSVAGKTQFVRGRRLDAKTAEVIGGPSSHLIATAARADVLVEIDAAITELTPDLEVPLWPLTR